MKSLKKDFNERLTTAADAKKALLEKFKSRPTLDDPAVADRRAAREALSKAREERLAERAVSRAADTKARIEAEERARREASAARRPNSLSGKPAKRRWRLSARPPGTPATPRARPASKRQGSDVRVGKTRECVGGRPLRRLSDVSKSIDVTSAERAGRCWELQ